MLHLGIYFELKRISYISWYNEKPEGGQTFITGRLTTNRKVRF
jgi:hypothetical protein